MWTRCRFPDGGRSGAGPPRRTISSARPRLSTAQDSAGARRRVKGAARVESRAVAGETETQAEGSRTSEADRRRRPGVVLVFSGTQPTWRVFPLQDGHLTLGRGEVPDERLSRAHAQITFTRDGRWRVRDLDSRNGTFVDGQRVQGEG